MADENPNEANMPEGLESRQGSADVTADDEKKKWIAQNGDNPLAQERAQDVPQPASNELKDLQNEMALKEHQAKAPKGDEQIEGRLNASANRENLNDTVRSATDNAQHDAGNQ